MSILSDAKHAVRRLDALVFARTKAHTVKGDVPGHEFHGNQFSAGGGSGSKPERSPEARKRDMRFAVNDATSVVRSAVGGKPASTEVSTDSKGVTTVRSHFNYLSTPPSEQAVKRTVESKNPNVIVESVRTFGGFANENAAEVTVVLKPKS